MLGSESAVVSELELKAAAKRNTIGTENGALKYHQVQAHLLSERMSSAVCLDKGL